MLSNRVVQELGPGPRPIVDAMPKWYTSALEDRRNPSACIGFAKDFVAAPPSERTEVVSSWDPELRWALPCAWRLACKDDAPGSPVDRIRTDLLFQALNFSGADLREPIMGFAVVFNSCVLAEVDPQHVFAEIADSVGGAAAQALRDFAHRDAEHQSMEAFMLEAIESPGGGYVLRAKW